MSIRRKKETTNPLSLYEKYPVTSFVSVNPVFLDDWSVQGSVLNNDTICIIMTHVETLKTHIRFFEDELKANMFVLHVLEDDPNVSEKSKP